jgi:UDPglucose 6-dehydrogenase
MKISVMGAGYVGLVAAACFADTGNDVSMVDIDERRIARLRSGKLPIFEPGLLEIVLRNAEAGRLTYTTEIGPSVAGAEVVILAVGTPSSPDGSVDMSWIDAVAEQVGRSLEGYTVVATKSTVPVGTSERITRILRSVSDASFDYVANPEFLKEGAALSDFQKPDRVIIGTDSVRAQKLMRQLYAPFMRRNDRLLFMDVTSAELTKYACNAMLATRISFVNELARLCESVGADITAIRRGMGTDPRIGPDFLYPSLGYGGSCFPKDIQALIHMGALNDSPMTVVASVHSANLEQRERMYSRILAHFDGDITGKRIGVWGLAFKARTDDVRHSPAITVVQRLVEAGATVAAHDPEALENARLELGDTVAYCDRMYDALTDADALLICTEWQQYQTPDFERMAAAMAGSVIFDGRNLYNPEWIEGKGLTYYSIGRRTVDG